jgi:uncharacterized repeat protein (TIGR01451 family)
MPNHTRHHSQPNVGLGAFWIRWNQRLFSVSALGLCGLCSCASFDGAQAGNATKVQSTSQSADPSTSLTVPGRSRLIMNVRSEMTIRSQSEADESFEPRQLPTSSRRLTGHQNQSRSTVGRSVYSPAVSPRVTSSRPRIQQVNGEQVRRVSNTDRAIERIAATTRTPANCPDVFAAGPAIDGDEASPTKYPDEYIFDGGDRAYPITRDNMEFRGIDTEDTIAEYKDHEGRPRIKKSNRVAIYAPRFGSVVTISGPNAETTVNKVSGHMVAQRGVGLRSRESTDEEHQNLATVRVQTRSRANGLGTEVGVDSLKKEVNREVGVSVMNTHQSRSQLRRSEFQENLKASSTRGRLFAENWTRKEFPVLEGHASSATQTVTLKVQAEFVGLEDNGKRGDLRLTKTADRGAANVGDLITFTIHYENRGDKELRNVVIIDNLSPRLEFDPDSVTTDRPGKNTAEDNEEGSVILKFLLDGPLPGRTKGSITFQARVK